jgi:DNA end-binding protein Ku
MWTGSISFGLVNVPVKAFTAVHDHTLHFHQLEKDTGARIRYEKVSGKSGRPVPADEIEKGFEVSKGHYVVVDAEELENLRPRSTRTIDITDFVELAAVDPIYYENTYWLGADGDAGDRAYRLLLQAMEDAGRVAIGTVVMRNKQYLAAVRPLDGALAMSTMRFADEVLPRDEIDEIPSARSKPAAKELRLASQIIESLASDWDPKRYHDTYVEQMRDLIERKAKGEEITVEEEEAEPRAKVLDLMAALQASVEGRDRRQGRAGPGRPRPAAAKRSTKAASSPRKSSPAKRGSRARRSKSA